jgi:cytochrome c biogenesis protein
MSSKTVDSAKKQFDPARVIFLLGSVKFGITLLVLLVFVSLAGMLVTQFNVPGFDRYYAGLGETRQTVFNALGLFDVYGSWYFNLLLMLLAMNIILSSVDHFPNTWRLIRRPKLAPSAKWLGSQEFNSEFEIDSEPSLIAKRVADVCKKDRLRRVIETEKNGRHFVFAESGAWNRLGAYVVHIALLTILAGGFVTSQFSFSGELPLTVGESARRIDEIVIEDKMATIKYRTLPFVVKCVDLEQRLIDPRGPLESANSIDWLTELEISDETGAHKAVARLNQPFDYRGYRFFHSKFLPIGKARAITIAVESAAGPPEKLTIGRNASVGLVDGTSLRFVDFRANLSLTGTTLNENSVDYPNPAAILEATAPDGVKQTVFAIRDNQPGDRSKLATFAGKTFRLLAFEKVSERHVLIVRHDPGAVIVYTGFALLGVSLLGVFFFSHHRIWFMIEEAPGGTSRVICGGNSNRDRSSFRNRLDRLIRSLSHR